MLLSSVFILRATCVKSDTESAETIDFDAKLVARNSQNGLFTDITQSAWDNVQRY